MKISSPQKQNSAFTNLQK